LAPDKIQLQLDFVTQLSQSTRAVFSNWQSLQKNGKVWLASGPVNQVAIPAPPYLRLVAPDAPPLGAALLRRQALAEVGGFPEALSFAGDENLLLRFAGMHENTRASRGRFVVAPSAAPLYAVRFFRREQGATRPSDGLEEGCRSVDQDGAGADRRGCGTANGKGPRRPQIPVDSGEIHNCRRHANLRQRTVPVDG